jgi:hypothetical protein
MLATKALHQIIRKAAAFQPIRVWVEEDKVRARVELNDSAPVNVEFLTDGTVKATHNESKLVDKQITPSKDLVKNIFDRCLSAQLFSI